MVLYEGFNIFLCGCDAQKAAVGFTEPSFEMFFQTRCLASNLLDEKEAHLIFASEDCCQHLCFFFKLQMFSLAVSEVIYQTAFVCFSWRL